MLYCSLFLKTIQAFRASNFKNYFWTLMPARSCGHEYYWYFNSKFGYIQVSIASRTDFIFRTCSAFRFFQVSCASCSVRNRPRVSGFLVIGFLHWETNFPHSNNEAPIRYFPLAPSFSFTNVFNHWGTNTHAPSEYSLFPWIRRSLSSWYPWM